MEPIQEQIQSAYQEKTTLRITGGKSKDFLCTPSSAPCVDITAYSGIVEYRPEELVITAKAGTSIATLQAAVAEHHQMLAFEAVDFGGSTLGGSVAAAMSGQVSAYLGTIRDFVLGVEIINGQGQRLRFGGKVMKNVAGYDVARLLTGSFGKMAAITEVSLKVLPRLAYSQSYQIEVAASEAVAMMVRLNHQHHEMTAMQYENGLLSYRLSANQSLEGNTYEGSPLQADFWQQDTVLRLPKPLWSLRVSANTPMLDHTVLVDLAGTRRFIDSQELDYIKSVVERTGAIAKPWGAPNANWPDPLAGLKAKLKTAFDPSGIWV